MIRTWTLRRPLFNLPQISPKCPDLVWTPPQPSDFSLHFAIHRNLRSESRPEFDFWNSSDFSLSSFPEPPSADSPYNVMYAVNAHKTPGTSQAYNQPWLWSCLDVPPWETHHWGPCKRAEPEAHGLPQTSSFKVPWTDLLVSGHDTGCISIEMLMEGQLL